MTDDGLATLIASAEAGDPVAAETAFAVLYRELHRLARRELARRGPQLTLGATTLLHEAYLDLAGRNGPAFPDRARFMGYAARVMRGLIVDYVRRRQALKRGGGFELTTLDMDVSDAAAAGPLERVSTALDALSALDPRLAQVVDLKYFCGFSLTEIAGMRGVSERTVQRDWEKARLFLYRELQEDAEGLSASSRASRSPG
jgi:RNA polymerase sigma factor (TIGR02999 family)